MCFMFQLQAVQLEVGVNRVNGLSDEHYCPFTYTHNFLLGDDLKLLKAGT
jgi:hypothetical protein